MLTLLFIIWVVCKIVDYCQDRADERELDAFEREIVFGPEKYGDTYNIDVDARQVHLYGGQNGDQRSQLPPEVQSW